MAATTPPTPPDFPQPTDTPEDFDDKAYDCFPYVEDAANNVYANAVDAAASAVASASSASSSATSATDSASSASKAVAINAAYQYGHQGSWPTVITTRNNGSALQQGDQFYYTGATGGGYTQNTTYAWNANLAQWEVAEVAGVFVKKYQIITASTTWNKPAKFIEDSLLLTGTGAGASGCSSGSGNQSGGNAGEWVYKIPVDVSAVSSVSVTIGPGGAAVNGGGVNTAGNAGGATTFGALVTLAGAAATPASGGRAATVGGPLGGVFNASSTPQLAAQSNMSSIGGNAGVSSAPGTGSNCDGAGGIVVDDSNTKGGSVTAMGGIGYGAGGASSTANTISSGAGANGVIFLEWEERQ